MTRTFEAIYADGVLRPLQPLSGIENNRRVTITVQSSEPGRPLEGWVGGMSDDDATAMRRLIEEEFEQVNSDDWK